MELILQEIIRMQASQSLTLETLIMGQQTADTVGDEIIAFISDAQKSLDISIHVISAIKKKAADQPGEVRPMVAVQRDAGRQKKIPALFSRERS